jgi:hypothetical protein
VTEEAAYERLELESRRPAVEIRDHSAAWEKLVPIGSINGTSRERIEAFCRSKRITIEALEAFGVRVDVRGQELYLAWGHTAHHGERRPVTALKFRRISDGRREARKPSTFNEPLVAGDRSSRDWFLAEGETDAARLFTLVGDLAAVMLLPAGALTFKREWADFIPRGASVFAAHDADGQGDEGAAKAAAILGASAVRVRPPGGVKDWCEWDGERGAFVELVREAKVAARPRLEVLTACELCQLPDPPESDMLLGPIVVRAQRLVLGAHTGEGKTTMALAMVRAVVEGGEFLEWTGAGGGRALVIDAEQGLRTIKRRLREAGLENCELVDYVRVPDGLSLDSDFQHIAEVERLFEEGGYSLVVADPLYKLHAGDSNAEREAVDLMRRFDGWREQFGFALSLPVHCRKPVPGMRFTIHDVFGSSAYVRGAEVVLGLQRMRDGYSRLYFLKDRDGDLPIGEKWGLLFSREHGFRRDPTDGQPSTAERLAELRALDPGITQVQAAQALGVTDRTVRKYWSEAPEEAPGDLFDGVSDDE